MTNAASSGWSLDIGHLLVIEARSLVILSVRRKLHIRRQIAASRALPDELTELRSVHMSRTLPRAIGRLVAAPELRTLARSLEQSNSVTASGLWGSSVAAVVAALRAEIPTRPILLVCGHL